MRNSTLLTIKHGVGRAWRKGKKRDQRRSDDNHTGCAFGAKILHAPSVEWSVSRKVGNGATSEATPTSVFRSNKPRSQSPRSDNNMRRTTTSKKRGTSFPEPISLDDPQPNKTGLAALCEIKIIIKPYRVRVVNGCPIR